MAQGVDCGFCEERWVISIVPCNVFFVMMIKLLSNYFLKILHKY